MSAKWTREMAQNFVRQIELRAIIEELESLLKITGAIRRDDLKRDLDDCQAELTSLEKP